MLTCPLKGQVFHEMKSLNWLILLRIYLVWLSYSYCFIFDYNYSSFALRLQTSQHLILDLLYLKQWKAAKVRAKRINQNLEIFIGNTGPFNRLVNDKGVSVVRKEFDSFLVFGIFIQEKKLVSYFKLMYWFSHFEFIHNIYPWIILKIHRKVAMFSRNFPPAIIFS